VLSPLWKEKNLSPPGQIPKYAPEFPVARRFKVVFDL